MGQASRLSLPASSHPSPFRAHSRAATRQYSFYFASRFVPQSASTGNAVQIDIPIRTSGDHAGHTSDRGRRRHLTIARATVSADCMAHDGA